MKPAEIVSNLGILGYILKDTTEDSLRNTLLETIRICQLMAMKMTMDEIKELDEAERRSHV